MKTLLLAVSSLLASATVNAWYSKNEVLFVLVDNDDYCIGLNNDDVDSGSRLELKSCDEHEVAQCWNLKYRDSKYFRVHACNDDHLCVEITGDDEKDKLRLRSCKDDDVQYFTYNENGDHELTPKENRHVCAEPKTIKKNGLIWLQNCDGQDNQAFKFRNYEKSDDDDDDSGGDDDDDDDDSSKACDYVNWKEADSCSLKTSKDSCENCCDYYCGGQSKNCERKCRRDCKHQADCDDISEKCHDVSWKEADNCSLKTSTSSCENCCGYYCGGQSKNCERKCERHCKHQADCDDISEKCRDVSWMEADNCSKKTSTSSCENCCGYYCGGQSKNCERKCERHCKHQADCDDISEKCRDVSWMEADNCSKNTSTGTCENCCEYYCAGQGSNCEKKCERDCKRSADCDDISENCYDVSWMEADNCRQKTTTGTCQNCCGYYCGGQSSNCEKKCERDCRKSADCDDINSHWKQGGYGKDEHAGWWNSWNK